MDKTYWLPVILPDKVIRLGGKMDFYKNYEEQINAGGFFTYGEFNPPFKDITAYLSINAKYITHQVLRMKIDSIANNDRIMAEVKLLDDNPLSEHLSWAFQNLGYQNFHIRPRVLVKTLDQRTLKVTRPIAMDLFPNEKGKHDYFIG